MSDESYQKEPKYQKFQSATEKALKTFETSLQWTDQVSCLATLHKVWNTTRTVMFHVSYFKHNNIMCITHCKLFCGSNSVSNLSLAEC